MSKQTKKQVKLPAKKDEEEEKKQKPQLGQRKKEPQDDEDYGNDYGNEEVQEINDHKTEHQPKPDPCDQRVSNMPLDKQEMSDLKTILDKEMSKLPLHDHEKKMLTHSLEQSRFKSGVDIVRQALIKREEHDAAGRLEDIVPLFNAHGFWDEMPVPKLGEDQMLPEDSFDKPIEVKTLAQV